MRIEVLGEARLVGRGGPAALPAGHPGVLLQLLILHAGETVDNDVLSTALWPDADPAVRIRRLRVTASRLRRQLATTVGAGAIQIQGVDGGYRLVAAPASLDVVELVALAEQAESGDRSAARRALGLWRGEPFTGFALSEEVERQRARLVSLRQRLQALADPDAEARCDGDGRTIQRRPAGPANVPVTVPRPHLLDRLPAVGTCRLIALTAPAGFGKSTLLEQWVARQADPVLRTTLSPDAGTHAWSQLIADLTARLPDTGSTELAGPGAGWDHVDLLNLVADAETPIGIVIDDLQLGSNTVRSQIRTVVEQAPPWLTLAIASRTALPFPTGRLRAHGRAVRLTSADLAFTSADCGAVAATGGTRLTEAQTARLHQVTEGWPAAVVQLADHIAAIRDDHLAEWEPEPLEEQIDDTLAGLPDGAAMLAATIAHLGPIEPDIAAAAAAVPDATSPLEHLSRRGLLRVHEHAGTTTIRSMAPAMFRPLLRRLPREEVVAFHRRAADHFHSRGAPERALDHVLAGRDTEAASASLRSALDRALRHGDAVRLHRWASTMALPGPSLGCPTELPLLAAALLPPDRRGRWHLASARRRVHPSARAAIDAVDLTRAGRCRQALAAAEQARHGLADDPPTDLGVVTAVEALVALAETNSRILLGTPEEVDLGPPHHLDEVGWPWLYLRQAGLRALRDHVVKGVGAARALLGHAERRPGRRHPSWPWLGNGAGSATRAWARSDTARTAGERRLAVERARRVVRHVDRVAHQPMAVVARLVLQRALRRAGATAEVADVAADADVQLARHSDLAFLRDVRRELVERPDPPRRPVEAIEDLTSGERDVLRHLGTGISFEDIGAALHLSSHTVKTRARSLYRKLGVTDRTEAVRLLNRL